MSEPDPEIPSYAERVERAFGDPGPSGPASPDPETVFLRDVVARLRESVSTADLDEPSPAALRSVLASFRERPTAAAPNWLERMVAALVHDSRSGAPSGWRSSATDGVVHCAFECALGRLDLQAVASDEGRLWRLRGAVLADEREATRATLRRVDAEGPPMLVDVVDGAFAASVEPGRYEIEIELDDGLAAFAAELDLSTR